MREPRETLFYGGGRRGGKTMEMERLKAEAEAKGFRTITMTKERAEASREYYRKQRQGEINFWLMFGAP